jgi:hypothetical protein
MPLAPAADLSAVGEMTAAAAQSLLDQLVSGRDPGQIAEALATLQAEYAAAVKQFRAPGGQRRPKIDSALIEIEFEENMRQATKYQYLALRAAKNRAAQNGLTEQAELLKAQDLEKVMQSTHHFSQTSKLRKAAVEQHGPATAYKLVLDYNHIAPPDKYYWQDKSVNYRNHPAEYAHNARTISVWELNPNWQWRKISETELPAQPVHPYYLSNQIIELITLAKVGLTYADLTLDYNSLTR